MKAQSGELDVPTSDKFAFCCGMTEPAFKRLGPRCDMSADQWKEEDPEPVANDAKLDAAVAKALGGRRLAHADIAGLSVDQLIVVRNAPYARHGRAFVRKDLQTYFYGGKLGVKLDAEFQEKVLDPIDWANVKLVVDEQRSRK